MIATAQATASAAAPATRRWSHAGLLLTLLAAPCAAGLSGPSLTLPTAARALHADTSSAAWLMTAFGLGMLLGTPLLASTASRRGPRALLLTSATALLLGTAAILLGGSLAPLVLGRAATGVGAAGFNIAAFQLAARDGTGRQVGLVAIGSAAGGTAGLFVGAAAGRLIGWPAALVLPVFSLLVLPSVLALAPASGTTSPTTATGRSRFLSFDLLAHRRLRAAAATTLLLSTVNFGLVYGAPRRAAALTGWSPVQTGAAASLCTLAGALLSWQLVRVAPGLTDRRLYGVLVGGSLGALALAALAPWYSGVLLGAGTSAFANASGQGVLTGRSTTALPAGRQGEGIALLTLVFLLGATLGPQLAALA
ncbi:MFS transporter [Kitasatospora sp. NPDC051170]|uniref:MFS transporter n=1 Tax=Kitasatospora sp. NPDC051170 TaxID=3364056 RepID=UPI0037AC44FA